MKTSEATYEFTVIGCLLKTVLLGQVWWCPPIIPVLGRLRQKDSKFKDSLGYIARPCLKKKMQEKNKTI
jgi:hypothetical protein